MDKKFRIEENVDERGIEEKGKVKEIQEREEIVKMWKHIDEKLERKARSLNLTAINVKSILHHMIKNPEVISVIMGLDKTSSIADLKLTRSRTKHLSGQGTHTDLKQANIVAVPRASRTFLDINYDSNEEDDDDYLPEQDEDASEGEAENEVDAETSFEILNSAFQVEIDNDDNIPPALHTRSKRENNAYPEDMPNLSDDVLLYSAVDDPDYVEFISNLNDPSKYDLDEAEDPEYNFLSDADAEDIIEEYEVRKDRATEIPLREVENLLQDLLEARLLPSPEHLEQTMESVKDENKSCHLVKQNDHQLNMRKTKTILTGSLPGNIEPTTILVDASFEDFQKVSTTSSSLLYASVENPPFFSFYELQQLIAQFEKHVQLLTQFAVGCYFEKTMVKMYNAFQVMINELNDYCLERPEHSLFNVINLEACIVTCHDAIECETISDFVIRSRKSRKLQLPLPKTMLVLSRSKALIFPELLPQVRMKMFPTFYPYFTREEECLLALGLYQFAHLKQVSGKQKRYALISQHLLPNKMHSQIRLHLKNFRCSSQPVHALFMKAETGVINMIFPLENRSSATSGPPYLWPQHLQPIWLKELVDRQQHGLEYGDHGLDGLTFVKIANEKGSPSVVKYLFVIFSPQLALSACEYDTKQFYDSSSSQHIPLACIAESCTDSAGNRACDKGEVSRPIVSDIDNQIKVNCTNKSVNTIIRSVYTEQSEIVGSPSSPVHNLLLFASTAVCGKATNSSFSNSHHSIVVSPISQHSTVISDEQRKSPSSNSSTSISRDSRIVSSVKVESLVACSTVTSSKSDSTVSVEGTSMNKAVKFAPFKKIPPAKKSEMNKFGENFESNRYKGNSLDKIDESIGSSGSEGEIMTALLPSRSLRNSLSPEQSSKTENDSSDDVASQFGMADFNYKCSGKVNRRHENVAVKFGMSSYQDYEGRQGSDSVRGISRKSFHSLCSDPEASCDVLDCASQTYKPSNWIPITPNGNNECSSSVRWTPTSSMYFSDLLMFNMENKAVQCDLAISSSITNSGTTQISQHKNVKSNRIAQTAYDDSPVNTIEVFESVGCNDSLFAQNSGEIGEAKQGQNNQTVSNDGRHNSESVKNERRPSGTADGSKSSLPGDREDDGSDGEGNEPVGEEKRRRRIRTRRDRVRNGLYGMLDAQHRALQVKCMAHVIFNDFEQRMFMHQDKVRALCELIAEGSMSPELFEKMHDIFEEEHEPVYFLLSFLFPQNLLPTSVLENPVRKAYSNALEMIYNIEAFTSFGNTRLSARTIFRNVRDLGFDCTCEALTTRLSELIGNKGPLWEIISQNIPTRVCQSNHPATDFEYVDLSSWKKVDPCFENVDLSTAIGVETEKQRSGVFVGFLRNLFTERKGKLYEVVAEWKPTKHTPPILPRRRPPKRKTKKRKSKIPSNIDVMELSETGPSRSLRHVNHPSSQEKKDDALKVIAPRKNITTTLQFARKRSLQTGKVSEARKRRKKYEEILVKQRNIFTVDGSTSLVEVSSYDTNSSKNLVEDSGMAAEILKKNIPGSEILSTDLAMSSVGRVSSTERFVQCTMSCPIVANPTRKWTIEEDRKILYNHKENGPDLDLTLAAIQLELPEIPVDELRQRLVFLLSLLQRIEESGGK
uniref:Uncharacterized protein n=1 Tax=Setaria digitata TaxID=48799 RepID=A0A915PJU5_9BILA